MSEKEIAEIVAEVIKTHEFQLNGPGNENKIEFYWWGYSLYLDYENTNKLIAALKSGTAVAQIVSLILSIIPGALVILGLLIGLVTIILQAFYIDALIGCNELNKAGVIINVAYAGVTWISPQ